MVTHTWNLCSAFNPSKVHTHSSEHTPKEVMWRRPGSSCGLGVLLKGTSVVVLKMERALYIHSPHLKTLSARDSNSQPLTIRPRILDTSRSRYCICRASKFYPWFTQDIFYCICNVYRIWLMCICFFYVMIVFLAILTLLHFSSKS